jgi:hypothetical protein
MLFGGISEVSLVQEPEPEAVMRARSLKSILADVRYRLGTLPIEEQWAEGDTVDEQKSGNAAELAWGLAECAWQGYADACHHPIQSVRDGWRNIGASGHFLSKYRLNEEQAAAVPSVPTDGENRTPADGNPQGEIYCNNYAQTHCEKVNDLIPMYLFSIWPARRENRPHVPWHQMAVGKLGKNHYLILDNTIGIEWHGTLPEFVRQYGQNALMEIVPQAGIAPPLKPVYQSGPARLWMQVVYGIPEEEMQSANIYDDIPPRLAVKNKADRKTWMKS